MPQASQREPELSLSPSDYKCFLGFIWSSLVQKTEAHSITVSLVLGEQNAPRPRHFRRFGGRNLLDHTILIQSQVRCNPAPDFRIIELSHSCLLGGLWAHLPLFRPRPDGEAPIVARVPPTLPEISRSRHASLGRTRGFLLTGRGFAWASFTGSWAYPGFLRQLLGWPGLFRH